MVPLHGTPVLARLARADLPRARVLPLLPQQAGGRSVLRRSRLPVCEPCFPQPLWTTAWSVHWRLRVRAAEASQQQKARARTVTKVRLSAQPPANQSVPQLRPQRRWTTPTHGWATRRRSCPPSVRQRAPTAAAPCLTSSSPEGLPRKAPAPLRCARATRSCHPLPPPEGDLPIAALLDGSGCAAPATGPPWSLLPPCKHLECNAVGLLRQGLVSLRAPARWPPPPGCQHGSVPVACG